MTFVPHSQAGQDQWIFDSLGCKTDGTFLDIGCGHPIDISNTYALEQIGWTGWLVDNDPNLVPHIHKFRSSKFILGDSTQLDWLNILKGVTEIDYLSLDTNGGTLPTLKTLPLGSIRFKRITCEHDSYRFGNGPRDEMRKILMDHGYILSFADVQHEGSAYEDWYRDHK